MKKLALVLILLNGITFSQDLTNRQDSVEQESTLFSKETKRYCASWFLAFLLANKLTYPLRGPDVPAWQVSAIAVVAAWPLAELFDIFLEVGEKLYFEQNSDGQKISDSDERALS
ncbi:MAG TPA: hypothetical protein VHA52_03870 [Candidatus Babeliaceae bacterium]|nr:hypothetical protein [Candidatus Babeliaceae bacterium]